MPKKSRATPATSVTKAALDAAHRANPHLRTACQDAMNATSRGILAQFAAQHSPANTFAADILSAAAGASTVSASWMRIGAATTPIAETAATFLKAAGVTDTKPMGGLLAAYRQSMQITTAGQHVPRLADAHLADSAGFSKLKASAAEQIKTMGAVSAMAAQQNWRVSTFGESLRPGSALGDWVKSAGIARGRATMAQFGGITPGEAGTLLSRIRDDTSSYTIPLPVAVPVEPLPRIPAVPLPRREPVEDHITLGSVEENALLAWARKDTVHVSSLGSDQILWGEMIAAVEAIGWVLDRSDYHRDRDDRLHAIIMWRMAVTE